MRIFISLTVFFVFSAHVFGQVRCENFFEDVQDKVQKNYAGWNDKVTERNQAVFHALTDDLRRRATVAANEKECFSVLKLWIDYFRDKHLRVKFVDLEKKNGTKPKTQAISPPEIKLSETEAIDYLQKDKNLDRIEGIWKNENYRFAVLRDEKNPNHFNGVILSTKNEKWQPGEIKIVFVKTNAETYDAQFGEWDKSAVTPHKAFVKQNVLDIEVSFLDKEFPAVQNRVNFAQYVYDKDPSNPRLMFPQKDLAVFTLPNFYYDNLELLENLLKKNQARLEKTPYWTIDLRNNEGGSILVGNLLLPYLYTNPIKSWNAKNRLSAENVRKYISALQEVYDNSDAATKKSFDAQFALMQEHTGEMFSTAKNAIDSITFEAVKPFPRKVAILINRETVSSGELFVMLARQSKKVTIYGENSAGMIDYGDVLSYDTASPVIKLGIPFTRFNWLDEGILVDRQGLIPDRRIPKTVKNWIQFAYSNETKIRLNN